MSQKEKKDLLFFFSDVKCISAAGVIPMLAVLAKKQGVDFETYICTWPLSWGGKTLPFTGHMHGESFCYLALPVYQAETEPLSGKVKYEKKLSRYVCAADRCRDLSGDSVTIRRNGKDHRIQLPAGTYCGQPVTAIFPGPGR